MFSFGTPLTSFDQMQEFMQSRNRFPDDFYVADSTVASIARPWRPCRSPEGPEFSSLLETAVNRGSKKIIVKEKVKPVQVVLIQGWLIFDE